MKNPELEQRILTHVRQPNYRPVKPRVIARQLDLDEEERKQARMSIKRLVRRGLLYWGPNHAVCVVSERVPVKPESRHDSRELPDKAESEPVEKESRREQHAEPARSSETNRKLREPASDKRRPKTKKTAGENREPGARPEEREESGEEFGEELGQEVDQEVDQEVGQEEAHEAGSQRNKRPLVRGTFKRTAAGYGFVRPVGVNATDRRDDIYVAAKDTRDASDGDHVTVRVSRQRRGNDQRLSGEIVAVVERATNRFVGVYVEEAGAAWVQVDGKVFEQPISVGDPSAKDLSPGDKVVIEMVRFPSHFFGGEAVVVENLGPRGQPGVDTLSIMREFDLPGDFPEDVLESSREQAAKFDEANLRGRHDFTQETVITIDPVDARDFDDAISLQRLEGGHWRLGVHIADVGHFVPARSALDREAREQIGRAHV